MTKREEFGSWIRTIRKQKGISLKEVSTSLGYKSRGTIICVETGYTSLPVEKIHPLAKLYGLDPSEILDKIRECEPDLYAKYRTLTRDILHHYILTKHGIDIRLHHKPFPNALAHIEQNGAGLHMSRYRNPLYIIRTNKKRRSTAQEKKAA